MIIGGNRLNRVANPYSATPSVCQKVSNDLLPLSDTSDKAAVFFVKQQINENNISDRRKSWLREEEEQCVQTVA